jgi:hypothetical protein
VLRVVGVEVLLDELASAERVVVGVDAGRFLAEDAHGIAGEDTSAEPAFVLAAVAALACGAASQLGLASVVLAAPAVGVLGAAGDGADGQCATSGHAFTSPLRWMPLSIPWGHVVLERVARAVTTTGLIAAGCGLVYGMWPVGPDSDDCGSAFFPKTEAAVCDLAMTDRTNVAWLLTIAGGSVAVGALTLTREQKPAATGEEPAAAE